MGGKVGENPAALRAAVFSLSSKNLRGGGGAFKRPPPSRARVKLRMNSLRSLIISLWSVASRCHVTLGLGNTSRPQVTSGQHGLYHRTLASPEVSVAVLAPLVAHIGPFHVNT